MDNEIIEKNNGATPEFNRAKAIEKSVEEYFFKTDNNLRKLYDTDTSEKMEFFRDKRNFQNEINSCTDAKSLEIHLGETLREWKGKKSVWLEYTYLRIIPPQNDNNNLKKELSKTWRDWFESHKEQENEPMNNNVDNYKGTINTKNSIVKEFSKIDKNKGWSYAFKTENDFELFVNLLTKYFIHSDYILPKETIKLKINTKTRFAVCLKSLHDDLSEVPFKSNIKYFEIIRTLNHFEGLNDTEIYKALNK